MSILERPLSENELIMRQLVQPLVNRPSAGKEGIGWRVYAREILNAINTGLSGIRPGTAMPRFSSITGPRGQPLPNALELSMNRGMTSPENLNAMNRVNLRANTFDPQHETLMSRLPNRDSYQTLTPANTGSQEQAFNRAIMEQLGRRDRLQNHEFRIIRGSNDPFNKGGRGHGHDQYSELPLTTRTEDVNRVPYNAPRVSGGHHPQINSHPENHNIITEMLGNPRNTNLDIARAIRERTGSYVTEGQVLSYTRRLASENRTRTDTQNIRSYDRGRTPIPTKGPDITPTIQPHEGSNTPPVTTREIIDWFERSNTPISSVRERGQHGTNYITASDPNASILNQFGRPRAPVVVRVPEDRHVGRPANTSQIGSRFDTGTQPIQGAGFDTPMMPDPLTVGNRSGRSYSEPQNIFDALRWRFSRDPSGQWLIPPDQAPFGRPPIPPNPLPRVPPDTDQLKLLSALGMSGSSLMGTEDILRVLQNGQ